MKIKVYRLEVLIIDHDECGTEEIREVLENQRYPNDCIFPQVMSVEHREVEWSDNHPLNDLHKCQKAFRKLFSNA